MLFSSHRHLFSAAGGRRLLRRRVKLSSLPPSSSSSSSSSFSTVVTAPESELDLASPGAAALQRNADPGAVCVVTGASRGLGLEFARQLLLERTRGVVVAACRGGEGAASPGLAALRAEADAAGQSARLSVLDLDLASQDSVEAFAAALRERHGGRVDLLLNVAGILHDAEGAPRAPERALAHVEREWLRKTLEVNTMGPLMLAQALEPMMRLPRGALQKMKKKQTKQTETTTTTTTAAAAAAGGSEGKVEERGLGAEERPPSVVASVSARVGSISDNGLGGWYSYRISKAALNMATVNMALELKRSGVWCIALHPGTTDTDLSKPFQKNVKPEKLFSREFSVRQMLGVVDALDAQHTGGFFAWDGQRIEW
jgi:NAD(P)-dependent dehydrogenase (short-subunit alcohol dehydrogenase family)